MLSLLHCFVSSAEVSGMVDRFILKVMQVNSYSVYQNLLHLDNISITVALVEVLSCSNYCQFIDIIDKCIVSI